MELVSCEQRLKMMIASDKQGTSQKINKLLKSELLYVLKNYFDITSDDISLNIGIDEFGKYDINLCAKARSLKIAHVFNK